MKYYKKLAGKKMEELIPSTSGSPRFCRVFLPLSFGHTILPLDFSAITQERAQSCNSRIAIGAVI